MSTRQTRELVARHDAGVAGRGHDERTVWTDQARQAQHRCGTIRLNTERVEPKDPLEHVAVHERARLVEPAHSERFIRGDGQALAL